MVSKFLKKLNKYEKDGPDSMESAEWAHTDIDNEIVAKFSKQDWEQLNQQYKKKSDNLKSLIAGHIHLLEGDFVEIKLQILTDMVLNESEDVGFEALNQLIFGFIASGTKPETNEEFHRKELKGIFVDKSKLSIIKTYFTPKFLEKANAMAQNCSKFQKERIFAFIDTSKEFLKTKK